MSEFPFPKLLAFLKQEADQIEFMKVAAEVGLGPSDQEIAKLLLALQLYKAFYAAIPREIKSVQEAGLNEMRGLHDEVKFLADRTAGDAVKIGQWAEHIHKSIAMVQPKAVAEALHRRLLEETMAGISGSVQALAAAYGRMDAATGKLNAAAAHAEANIRECQTMTLRRVWMSAFAFSFALTTIIGIAVWFVFFAH